MSKIVCASLLPKLFCRGSISEPWKYKAVNGLLIPSVCGTLRQTVNSSRCYSNESSSRTIVAKQSSGTDNNQAEFNSSQFAQMLIQSNDDMPVEIVNPYHRDKAQCILCKYGVTLDYKNPKLLAQFLSPFTGRLYGRHITRLCLRQQELLEIEIEKSRHAGYLAVMLKSVEFLHDPKLFDPNNPIRPHKY